MIVNPTTVSRIALRPVNDNMKSTILGLIEAQKSSIELSAPHRLYMFLGQAAHESGMWRYDRELWGPTPAQARYDTRTDLGNTPQADGDGYRYRGRSGFQITGKANYATYTAWAKTVNPNAPDFVENPDLMNTDPWEGLAAVWFWQSHGLNHIADTGDIHLLTKIINGGYNGLDDRIRCTLAAGLALAGYPDVKAFQKMHELTPDGVAGPITLGVLHKTLAAAPAVNFSIT